MITIPGTPSNYANMYLMTYSFLPAPAGEAKAMCASCLETPVPYMRASGDFPTCATAMWPDLRTRSYRGAAADRRRCGREMPADKATRSQNTLESEHAASSTVEQR
jgi:hypothetical protein